MMKEYYKKLNNVIFFTIQHLQNSNIIISLWFFIII